MARRENREIILFPKQETVRDLEGRENQYPALLQGTMVLSNNSINQKELGLYRLHSKNLLHNRKWQTTLSLANVAAPRLLI